MGKDTQQQCIISKCVFNGHSIKIKQNHISKVYICVYRFEVHFQVLYILGVISSWMPELFLQIQLTQNVQRLIASHALKDRILTILHILDTLEISKAMCNFRKFNTNHERRFQHKIQALQTLEQPQNIPPRVNALCDYIYSKIFSIKTYMY